MPPVAMHGRWLWRCGSPRDGDVRLFCLPCAGHGASMYSAWATYLPRSIEVWALQLPGRENRLDEVAMADMRRLVREAVGAVAPLVDTRPFAIVGHSMGALIAFEMTRELRRRGTPLPHRLVVSGHTAPQTARIGPPRAHLPNVPFLNAVLQLNGSQARDEEYLDAMRFMLPTIRTDFALCERYVYAEEPALACHISAWGGEDDPETSVARLAAWGDQTTASFSLRMFPGDHFFLMAQQRTVLRALADDLAPLLGQAAHACRAPAYVSSAT